MDVYWVYHLMTSWVRTKLPRYDRVQELLAESERTNHFTNGGPASRELESLAHRLLRLPCDKTVVAVSNGAIGINAIAAAIDIDRGRRVQRYATQAFTFPCSAQMEFDGRTTIVDVTPAGDLDLDAVPSECDGLVVTNVFGTAGRVSRYVEWQQVDPSSRVLIFDNAAAPFTFTADGTNLCALGTASMVSLHHTKPIGFGEGGLVVVSNRVAPILRRVINFGYDPKIPKPWLPCAGNGKMSDVAAAFIIDGLEQRGHAVENDHRATLDRMRDFAKRTAHPRRWRLLLDDDACAEGLSVSPSALCIVFDTVELRKQFQSSFPDVEIRQYYRPIDSLPNAMAIYDSIACVPCHIDVHTTNAMGERLSSPPFSECCD